MVDHDLVALPVRLACARDRLVGIHGGPLNGGIGFEFGGGKGLLWEEGPKGSPPQSAECGEALRPEGDTSLLIPDAPN